LPYTVYAKLALRYCVPVYTKINDPLKYIDPVCGEAGADVGIINAFAITDPVIEPGDTTLIDDPDVSTNDELLVNPMKESVIVVGPLKLAVELTESEPVIIWLPLKVLDPVVANTVEFNPSNKSAFAAYDDVIAKLAVVVLLELTEKLDVTANDEVDGTNVILVAADDVIANDALVIVPVNDPVNDPLNDPVFICVELLTNPFGLLVIEFQSLVPPPPPFIA
jgi:hypothetical protein